MKLRKKIRVMKAALRGAPIQHKNRKARGVWWDSPAPAWNGGFYTYRAERAVMDVLIVILLILILLSLN